MSANNKSNDNDATRIASVGDEDLVKYDVEHSEATAQYAVEKPESIRNMSAEEIKKLETRMVRKMDFVIMPIMGILYLLNCE